MTTAVIAERPVENDLDTRDSEEFSETDAAILDAMLAKWSDGDDSQARKIAFELKLIIALGPNPATGHRRSNPKARAMRHKGCRYQIRKDHGTKAFYKEIDALRASIENDKQSKDSVRGRRKQRKHEARSGNPRYKASAQR